MKIGRKISGGKYKKSRKMRKYEKSGKARMVALGKERKKELVMRGNNSRVVLLSADKANVLNPKTKKVKVCKIKSILETPANRFLKNVLIKGAIIDTELGKARITNRPGQESSIQAVLIE